MARVGPVHYNTMEEIHRFMMRWEELRRGECSSQALFGTGRRQFNPGKRP